MRGAVFEALVQHWAISAGYVPVPIPTAAHPATGDSQLFDLHGLPMVHGLGEGHNADVLLDYPIRLALTPKLRLLIECKGYGSRVGLSVIRGALGLRTDINLFRQISDVELRERQLARRPPRAPAQFPHYHVAVASLFGFSEPAQSYAAAHHIELLDYSGLPILGGIADVVKSLTVARFYITDPEEEGAVDDNEEDGDEEVRETSLASAVSRALLDALKARNFDVLQESVRRAEISETSPGVNDLERIFGMAQSVRAAYTATLANGLHFQLLARQPLSAEIFANHINAADGAVNFEIYYDRRETKTWRLVFGGHTLEFSLPRVLLNAWRRGGEQGVDALRIKQGHFRRIDIVGPFSATEQGRPLIRHIVGKLDVEFLRRALDAAGVRDAQI